MHPFPPSRSAEGSWRLTWGSAPHPGSVACGDCNAPRRSLAGARVLAQPVTPLPYAVGPWQLSSWPKRVRNPRFAPHNGLRTRCDGLRQQWKALGLAATDVAAPYPAGELAHAADHPSTLGDADGAARVEQIERVAALAAVIVGREHQLRVEQPSALLLEEAEELEERVQIGDLEVVARELDLLPVPHLAVSQSGAPLQIVDAVDARDERGDAFEPVGYLDADRVQIQPCGLLEVGELRDLQAVEQDLPPDSPCPERRRLPVVLLEAEVVLP